METFFRFALDLLSDEENYFNPGLDALPIKSLVFSAAILSVITWAYLGNHKKIQNNPTREKLQPKKTLFYDPERETPDWAMDPISFELMETPMLAYSDKKNPLLCHTYDSSSLQQLKEKQNNTCAFTRRRIFGSVLNKPLQAAIRDWIQSPKASANLFFKNKNAVGIPGWAKSVLSQQILKEPCLVFINGRVLSMEKIEAERLKCCHLVNHPLKEAIESWVKTNKSSNELVMEALRAPF